MPLVVKMEMSFLEIPQWKILANVLRKMHCFKPNLVT